MEEWEKYFAEAPAPPEFEDVCKRLEEFCLYNAGKKPIVLVTSGGTTVPLEQNTVRFVDNFSAGTRGAASTEYFLKAGYAVIFLHREKSIAPYTRHLSPNSLLKNLDKKNGELKLNDELTKMITPVWEEYNRVLSEKCIFMMTFTTLSNYLWLLRAATQSLQKLAPTSLLYLAAAVSDFYIPQEMMTEHKIQSSSGPLTVTLQLVPKMLRPLVSLWGPQLFVVSFKLETDESKLIEKAMGALSKYKHRLVIGNLLQTRREEVTLVSKEDVSVVKLSDTQKQTNVEIELLIVNDVCKRHKEYFESFR
ncbi:phosphopantothenoylcysteine synthetase isoform X2 [Oratosquilla oratoria]|uniref:phosphopantothenoylcysteine synthetase isoform X2 n=1 Tax=Oratosquilla oratoria TaxID=337810 RepID=UPI003F77223E